MGKWLAGLDEEGGTAEENTRILFAAQHGNPAHALDPRPVDGMCPRNDVVHRQSHMEG